MKIGTWALGALAGTAVLAAATPRAVRAQGYDAPPPGSYWQSCQNVRVTGGRVLWADCRDMRGAWRSTSLRFTDCRGEIENRDGQLSCYVGQPGRYPPPGGGYDGAYGNGYGGGPYGGGYGNNYGGGEYPPNRRRPSAGSITLFDGPDFAGQAFGSSREITNLPRRYNDHAMSLKVSRGSAWEVCTDSDFGGRCQVFGADVADLNRFGLAQAITSMRQVR